MWLERGEAAGNGGFFFFGGVDQVLTTTETRYKNLANFFASRINSAAVWIRASTTLS